MQYSFTVTQMFTKDVDIEADSLADAAQQIHRRLYEEPNSDGLLDDITEWESDTYCTFWASDDPYSIIGPADLSGLMRELVDKSSKK